ncbi:MAG TPA: hypothetical protein PK156_19770 [Polyangium sp.]|nr:hypothetical protein [Polyangium sp.]
MSIFTRDAIDRQPTTRAASSYERGRGIAPSARRCRPTGPHVDDARTKDARSNLGRGLGLSVPNQDPDVRKLGLSPAEKAVLVEFLRVALVDATAPEKLIGKPVGKR